MGRPLVAGRSGSYLGNEHGSWLEGAPCSDYAAALAANRRLRPASGSEGA